MILLLNCDLQQELPLLWVKIRNHVSKSGCLFASIGNNYGDSSISLGHNWSSFISILEGNHLFSKDLINAKKPLILFNETCLKKDLNNAINILEKMNSNVETCVINTDIADSGLFELGCDLGSKEDFRSLDLNIDIGSDISNSVKDIAKFNIFIGSHGNSSLLNYDVILPSNTFFEKDSFFMNFNGKVQKTSKVSKLLPETRSEESILENLMIYLTSQNSEMFFSESSKFDSLDKLTCYSLSENNGLKGVNLHHKTRNSVEKLNNFSSTIDNYYLSNSISSSSKVMQECSLINTKLKNF